MLDRELIKEVVFADAFSLGSYAIKGDYIQIGPVIENDRLRDDLIICDSQQINTNDGIVIKSLRFIACKISSSLLYGKNNDQIKAFFRSELCKIYQEFNNLNIDFVVL